MAGRRASRSSPPGWCRLAFQALVLRALRDAAAIVRVIATIGLLGLLQAVVLKRYGAANQPVDSYLPNDVFEWGGIIVQEERLYLVGHHARRHRRRSGRGPATPGSASPSTPAPRTSGRCRRSAGRPTASPRSPGRSAGCSAASRRCWPRRSPGCRRRRSRSSSPSPGSAPRCSAASTRSR